MTNSPIPIFDKEGKGNSTSVIDPRYILGIDPGFTGALAYYDSISKKLVSVHDIPVFEFKGKRVIDLYNLAAIIKDNAKFTRLAVLEDPNAAPGQGVVSMFNFGKTCGILQGVVAAYFIEIVLVKPSIWKMAMNLSSNKQDSLNRAIKLFPENKNLFARKKDDGRAEAALLCVYGGKFS